MPNKDYQKSVLLYNQNSYTYKKILRMKINNTYIKQFFLAVIQRSDLLI